MRPAGLDALVLLLAYVSLLLKAAAIPFYVYLKRLCPVLPIVAYSIFIMFYAEVRGSNLFMNSGFSAFSDRMFFFGKAIKLKTPEEAFAISLLLKTFITCNAVLAFSASTRFAHIVEAMSRFGFPALFVKLFSSTWRYLETVIDEALIMRTALVLKFFRPRDIFAAGRFSRLFLSLFVRTVRRAELNNVSIRLRGGSGARASAPIPFGCCDYVFAASTAAVLILCLRLR